MICPTCSASQLKVFFKADAVPIFCNVLHKTVESARQAPVGDIQLGYCHACGMIYNVAFDPQRARYAEGYENSLHGSPHFQAYAEQVARRLVQKYSLHDREIVEIGSGRGEFLDLLCRYGNNHGVGYDPSAPDEVCVVPGRSFRILQEGFSEASIRENAGLICSRHVLEHLAQPGELVSQLAAAAAKSGAAIYLEVPNGLWTLRDLGIWDIIYEHCSYFVSSSLRALLESSGLPEARIYEAFHGQFLAAESPGAAEENGERTHMDTELRELGPLVERFRERYQERVDYWRGELEQFEAEDKGVAVWGAGSKGVTFLHTVGNLKSIRCVVDINPLKQGKFTAGSGHPVVAPETLRHLPLERVVVMNPVYLDEISNSLQNIGFRGEVMAV